MGRSLRRIISQKMKDEKRLEIKEVFRRFDINKDEQLHVYEFQEALVAMGFNINEDKIKGTLLGYKKQNKRITYFDFEKIVMELVMNRDPLDELLSIFKIFDYDNSGSISFSDLKHITQELGKVMSGDEIQSLIDEFDEDGDKEIGENEFLKIMSEDV